MTRFLLGCFVALCVGFVTGCGGGSTETTVVEQQPITMEEQLAMDEAYEAEMNSDSEEDPDGETAE